MPNGFRYRPALLACCLLLSACGGGGTVTPPPSTPAPPPPAPPPPPTIGQPQGASLRGNTPLLAAGATPNFTTLPAVDTVFPFADTVLHFTAATGATGEVVTDTTNSLTGGTTLTFKGTEVVNGITRNIYEFKEPGLSLDATTSVATGLPDGRFLSFYLVNLNYTLLGFWNLSPLHSVAALDSGAGFSGYQTPPAGVPISGSATYIAGGAGSATGVVLGNAYVPNGSNVLSVGLDGQASIGVNFSNATVNGSLTHMMAGAEGDVPSAWNDVALTGTLSGATMQGTTTVTVSPADPNGYVLGAGAKGSFVGALFGPHGEELGMSWNLYDRNGSGNSAVGVVGATKQ